MEASRRNKRASQRLRCAILAQRTRQIGMAPPALMSGPAARELALLLTAFMSRSNPRLSQINAKNAPSAKSAFVPIEAKFASAAKRGVSGALDRSGTRLAWPLPNLEKAATNFASRN